jgi:ferredoxin
MRIDPDECVGCGQCISTVGIGGGESSKCPTGALQPGVLGYPKIDQEACVDCGKCKDLCGVGAIKQ